MRSGRFNIGMSEVGLQSSLGHGLPSLAVLSSKSGASIVKGKGFHTWYG